MKWICVATICLSTTAGCSSLVATSPAAGYASLEFADARGGKDSIPRTFQSVGGLDISTTESRQGFVDSASRTLAQAEARFAARLNRSMSGSV